MAFSHAFLFRQLAQQLTESETRSFINSLTKLIIEALSSHFTRQSTIKDHDSLNIRYNEALSAIIDSRVDDGSDETNNANLCLDMVPLQPLSVCASFLNQPSYAAFSRCHKATYMACSSPFVLREVKVHYRFSSDHDALDM